MFYYKYMQYKMCKIEFEIIWFQRKCVLTCDGKCEKVWGIDSRLQNNKNQYLKDVELETAPVNPETYEGGEGKVPKSMNK